MFKAQSVYYITVSIIPTFGTDTTCETLYRLELLYVLIYVRVGCIFKLGWINGTCS